MNHRIVAYGEDALTYWAISQGLPLLLERLTGSMPTTLDNKNDCLVFYRPSFGRRHGFGEFDAIVATPGRIFLIESKWHPPNLKVPTVVTVKLRKEQVSRHETWTEYWLSWMEKRLTTISPKRLLHSHLEFVFQTIGELQLNQPEISNICLYFVPEGQTIPKVTVIHSTGGDVVSSFRGIAMHYPPLNSMDGFVELSAHLEHPKEA